MGVVGLYNRLWQCVTIQNLVYRRVQHVQQVSAKF
jgi:hypothetical protein